MNFSNGLIMHFVIIYTNLILLILFPVSWFLPLFEVGLISEIKFEFKLFGQDLPAFVWPNRSDNLSSVQSIWADDPYLAILVTFFALVAPMLKTTALALMHFKLLSTRLKPVVLFLGKLAMADVFLIAFGCVMVKGLNLGQLNILWGTYFLVDVS